MKKQKEAETAHITELHEEGNTVLKAGLQHRYLQLPEVRAFQQFPPHPTPKWFHFSSAQVCKNLFGQFCKKIFRDKIDLHPHLCTAQLLPLVFIAIWYKSWQNFRECSVPSLLKSLPSTVTACSVALTRWINLWFRGKYVLHPARPKGKGLKGIKKNHIVEGSILWNELEKWLYNSKGRPTSGSSQLSLSSSSKGSNILKKVKSICTHRTFTHRNTHKHHTSGLEMVQRLRTHWLFFQRTRLNSQHPHLSVALRSDNLAQTTFRQSTDANKNNEKVRVIF